MTTDDRAYGIVKGLAARDEARYVRLGEEIRAAVRDALVDAARRLAGELAARPLPDDVRAGIADAFDRAFAPDVRVHACPGCGRWKVTARAGEAGPCSACGGSQRTGSDDSRADQSASS